MPKFKDIYFGTKGKSKQISTINPLQEELMKLLQQGLTTGEGVFGDIFGNKGFDQEAFDKGVTNPALKNFQENILPILQEKFIAGGQVGGSGMQNAQNKAGVDLQSELAALMYQAQQGEKQQSQQNQMQGVNQLLGKQTVENIYKPGTKGAFQGFAEGAGQGAGMAAGSTAG